MDCKTRHIFVDESGDTDMFDKKGRPLPNVSKLFMIGLSIVDNPEDVRIKLNNLRNKFLNDPYFKDVPSFQPAERKTAIMLHAKDDVPELRWKVYELLKEIPVKTTVVIRRKADLMRDAKSLFLATNKVIPEDIIYDNVVISLFRYVSHNNGDYSVKFAIKKKQRNNALCSAILSAQKNLTQRGMRVTSQINVSSEYSHCDACLQLIDYYLWAIHRFFIKNEVRYLDMIKGNINVILDMDDTRNYPGGELYTRHNQIDLNKKMPVNS
ncbi:hypothetical protein MASR1M36_05990 [Candidatus Cloacimonadaceae bacterium]